MHEYVGKIAKWVLLDTPIDTKLEEEGLVDEESKNLFLLPMIKLFSMENSSVAEQNKVIEEIYAKYGWLETAYIRERRSFPVIFSAVRDAAKYYEITPTMLLHVLSDQDHKPDEKIAS